MLFFFLANLFAGLADDSENLGYLKNFDIRVNADGLLLSAEATSSDLGFGQSIKLFITRSEAYDFLSVKSIPNKVGIYDGTYYIKWEHIKSGEDLLDIRSEFPEESSEALKIGKYLYWVAKGYQLRMPIAVESVNLLFSVDGCNQLNGHVLNVHVSDQYFVGYIALSCDGVTYYPELKANFMEVEPNHENIEWKGLLRSEEIIIVTNLSKEMIEFISTRVARENLEAERRSIAEEAKAKAMEEAERKRSEAEKEKEEAERKKLEEAEAERKRSEAEKEKEEAERKKLEEAEAERKRLEAEKEEAEAERKRLEAEKEEAEAEKLRNLAKAEAARKLLEETGAAAAAVPVDEE